MTASGQGPRKGPNGTGGDKLVYRLEEVVRLTRLDAAVIQAAEQEFPFLNAGRTGNGQKFFRPRDVEILRRVKELLDQKTLTMAGIKRRIEEEFGLLPAQPLHPEKLRKALYNIRDELQQLAAALDGPAQPPKKK